MPLPLVATDLPAGQERQHRTIIANALNECIKVRPPHDRTEAEIDAGVTPIDTTYPPGHVKRYGAKGDGVTDDTAAIQTAIDVAEAMNSGVGGYVYFSEGDFLVTEELLMSASRIHVRGPGPLACRIVFAPSANGVCFMVHGGLSAIVRSSITGICFFSNDDDYTKTAIELVDTEEFTLDDVQISGSVVVGAAVYWSGGTGSIGLRTRGRQITITKGVFQVAADRPILIDINPNNEIDFDHSKINSHYLIANGHPCIEVVDGVDLTNFTARDGAWVFGTDGFRWIDTTTSITASGFVLDDIRREQTEDDEAYFCRIEHNQTLYGVKIKGCKGNTDQRGIKLRNVWGVTLEEYIHDGTLIALDVDSSVIGIDLQNCFWQVASTASMTGQRVIRSSPENPNGGALPPDAYYGSASNGDVTAVSDAAHMGSIVEIEQDMTAVIGTTALQGFLFVTTDENVSAIYCLKGPSAATAEVSDPDGFFTITAASSPAYNIYATGGNYVIENKRANGTHNVRWFLLGAHTV